MRCEKVAGALQRPNSTRLNFYSWPLLVRNTIFGLSASRMGTCQYLLFQSRVENQQAPWRASNRLQMLNKGCTSMTVAAFNCRKSMQKRSLPSFFCTITTGDAQGLLKGRITPLSNICWTCSASSHHTVRFC